LSQQVTQILSNEYECRSSISDKLPEFIFTIHIDTLNNDIGQDHAVTRIRIRRADKKNRVQTLKPLEMYQAFAPRHFELIDMNFDGFKDILLQYGCGATGNGQSYTWLYDPKTGRFKYNNALSQITTATAHPDTKTITSLWVGGAAVYDEETYTFQNGKLTKIKEVAQDANDKLRVLSKTTKTFRNNILIKTVFDTTSYDSLK